MCYASRYSRVIALEGNAIIASGVDLLLVIGITVIARYGYGPLTHISVRHRDPCARWRLLGSAALISIVISRRVKVLMTPLEATVAASWATLGAVLTYPCSVVGNPLRTQAPILRIDRLWR